MKSTIALQNLPLRAALALGALTLLLITRRGDTSPAHLVKGAFDIADGFLQEAQAKPAEGAP